MMRWLGSAVPAKPPKQKLFGDKPKYLPGFGGTPGGGTPTPPAEKPPAKKSSAFIWILGSAAVVGGVWWLSSGRMLENPGAMSEEERRSRIWELKFDLSLWQGRERDPKRTPLQRSIANDKVVEIQRELLALQKKTLLLNPKRTKLRMGDFVASRWLTRAADGTHVIKGDRGMIESVGKKRALVKWDRSGASGWYDLENLEGPL